MKPTEGKIRLTAFFVLAFTLLFIWMKSPVIPAFLVVDFFLRAFGFGKFSPIMNLSNFIAKYLIFKEKPVFFPPKQFAAKIGFAFCVLIFTLTVLKINAVPVAIILCVFASLEAFFNFCAGCYVYNFYYQFKNRN